MSILVPTRRKRRGGVVLANQSAAPAPTYLLDDYPALEAWAPRQLISTATNAMRVRRASDNTLQDIGFVDGDLDTSSLATFCAGTDGFVERLYGQMGVADAVQADAGSQPKIYDSVTGVNLENGKPALFHAIASRLVATLSFSNPYIFAVGRYGGANPADLAYCLFSSVPQESALDRLGEIQNNTTNWLGSANNNHYLNGGGESATAIPTISSQFLLFAWADGDTGANTAFVLGDNSEQFNRSWSSTYQDIIMYTVDPTANRSAIEAEINTYYSLPNYP